LYKSVPPLNDLFNMAGMDLPDFLAKKKADDVQAPLVEMEEVGSKKENADDANSDAESEQAE
jgi:flotillin